MEFVPALDIQEEVGMEKSQKTLHCQRLYVDKFMP
jgi:hypothetical protein